MSVAKKLIDAASTMSDAERAGLKILLAAAAAQFLPSLNSQTDRSASEALAAVVATVAGFHSRERHMPPNGVVFRGRPSWVTNGLLSQLRQESESLRPLAQRFHDHLVVSGSSVAKGVCLSTELSALLNAYAGSVEPTGKANYLYYDEVGMGIEPHLDTEEFSLNTIMLLRHEHQDVKSALVLHPVGEKPERVTLEPGEIIVFFADSVVHARERMSQGEVVTIAAFGFRPTGDRGD